MQRHIDDDDHDCSSHEQQTREDVEEKAADETALNDAEVCSYHVSKNDIDCAQHVLNHEKCAAARCVLADCRRFSFMFPLQHVHLGFTNPTLFLLFPITGHGNDDNDYCINSSSR